MRILVISDTHIPTQVKTLPEIIKEEAIKCDCCLHCGDFTSISVYKTLCSWVNTYAVCGNMDDDALRRELPPKRILRFNGIVFGLIHGGGHPDNLISYVQNQFLKEADAIDIFVFGHSHRALDEEREGKIYFNPGSPTDTMFTATRSYGILTVDQKKLKRRIVQIE